jgi:integrase
MLGHSTVAITLDVYPHVTPAMNSEAAWVMNELFA